MTQRSVVIVSFLAALLLSPLSGRTWTDQEGRQFEGKMETLNDQFVHIRRAGDNKAFQIDRSILSKEDQEYLRQIEIEEEVEAFMEKYPSTLDASTKLSKREDLPVMAFYIAGMSEPGFRKQVHDYLMDEKFLKLIEGRLILAIIPAKDPILEEKVQAIESLTEPYYYFLYRGTDVCGVRHGLPPSYGPGWGPPKMEEFLKKVTWGMENVEDFKRMQTR